MTRETKITISSPIDAGIVEAVETVLQEDLPEMIGRPEGVCAPIQDDLERLFQAEPQKIKSKYLEILKGFINQRPLQDLLEDKDIKDDKDL